MEKYLLLALLCVAPPVSAQVTIAVGQADTAATAGSNAQIWPGCASSCMSFNPAYVMLPGASRRVWTNVCNGANVWGGNNEPLCSQPATIAVTWTLNSGPCTVPGGQTSVFGTITTTAGGTTGLCSITATSVQDNTKSVTFHVLKVVTAADALGNTASMALHYCGNTKVATCVFAEPFYEVLYQGQYADLQGYVDGNVNVKVTWTVSPNNGGLVVQNGTSNRDLALKAVTAGTYTVTATSVADGTASGTSKIIVTANSIAGQTRTSKVIPVDCTVEGSGTTYNVTDDTSFAAVPWSTLGPGDTVTIHAKAALAAYAIPFRISTSGTNVQPIRVCGIPDGSGNLPILTGVNSGPGNLPAGDQPYGMVILHNTSFEIEGCTVSPTSCTQPPEPDPHSIIIEGLNINSAISTSARTGGAAAFIPGAACIRVQARDVLLRGNECNSSSDGLFSVSTSDSNEARMVRHLTVEGNYIWGNGENGGQHDNYLQGEMLLYQWNWVGVLKNVSPNNTGGSFKDRFSYSVVRYNYIQGSNGRLMDMVELEDWVDMGIPHDYYNDNYTQSTPTDPTSIADVASAVENVQHDYIYGNVLDNNQLLWGEDAGYPIHYFPDVFPESEKGGILYFYHNTFREVLDLTGTFKGFSNGSTNVFDSTRIGPMPFVWPRTQITNNAFDLECATGGCTNGTPLFSFTAAFQDILQVDKNWVTTGWNTTSFGSGPSSAWSGCCGSPSHGGNTCFQGSCSDTTSSNNIAGTGSLVTGSVIPFNGTTFVPAMGSPLLMTAAALPAGVSDLPPEFNYQPDTQAISLRPDLSGGVPTTIGALGATGNGPATPAAPTRLGVLFP